MTEEKTPTGKAIGRAAGHPHRWKPGQSGNPRGRKPKIVYMSEIYRDMVAKVCPVDKEGRTWGEVLGEMMMRKALKDTRAAIEIADRTEGKPMQKVQISSQDNSTIEDNYDFTKLSSKDVVKLLHILRKARRDD